MSVSKTKRLLSGCLVAIALAFLFTGFVPARSAHARFGCGSPGWIYDNVTNWGSSFIGITPTYRSYNGTPSNATGTFTATVTGTVTLTASIGASVDASAIIAGISASLNISVSASISTAIGHAITIPIPPYRAGYGQYGVSRLHTTGHYYFWQSDCKIGTDYGIVSAYSPWYPTWNTWIGS